MERAIPAALLQNAQGYAILSVVKVGLAWSAALGSGLIVARRTDGSWSPPSAIGIGSLGWGLQVRVPSAAPDGVDLLCSVSPHVLLLE